MAVQNNYALSYSINKSKNNATNEKAETEIFAQI